MDNKGTLVKANTIATASGRYFDYRDPRPEQVDIDDIAGALSNLCRYTGHSARFYSVAEHSVLCCRLAQHYGYHPEVAYAALMHDAAEAYIGDMNRPLKVMMYKYQKLEKRVEDLLQQVFHIEPGLEHIVKILDMEMMKAEKPVLFPNDTKEWFVDLEHIRKPNVCITGWVPTMAKRMFMYAYEEMVHNLNLSEVQNA